MTRYQVIWKDKDGELSRIFGHKWTALRFMVKLSSQGMKPILKEIQQEWR